MQRLSYDTASCGTPTPKTARTLRSSCRSSSHTCRQRSCCSTREPAPTWRHSSHTRVSGDAVVVAAQVTVKESTGKLLCYRETHAEDWPPPAGVHVFKLHVAEDESGGRTVKVRESPRRSSPHCYWSCSHMHTHTEQLHNIITY